MDNDFNLEESKAAAKELLKYIEEHPESLPQKGEKIKSVEDYTDEELIEALLTPIKGTEFDEEDFIPDDMEAPDDKLII